MTGGREGSNILQKNEVLHYPSIYSDLSITQPGYTLKRWQWANEKAKQSEVHLKCVLFYNSKKSDKMSLPRRMSEIRIFKFLRAT